MEERVSFAVQPCVEEAWERVRVADVTFAADERYAVQLANDVTWEGGVNWLDASVQIEE